MPTVRLSTRFTLSIALWIFVLAALWLTAVPDTLRPSTYVSIAALLTALAAITMKTYMSGQATGSLGTLLYKTNSAPATASHAPAPGYRTPTPRMD
jgi:hypothetical protein